MYHGFRLKIKKDAKLLFWVIFEVCFETAGQPYASREELATRGPPSAIILAFLTETVIHVAYTVDENSWTPLY